MIKIFLALFFLTSCQIYKNHQQELPTSQQVRNEEVKINDVIAQISEEFPTKDFLVGKTNYSNNSDFIKIPKGDLAIQEMWLNKEVYESFLKMHAHAKKEGVKLQLLSGARNYKHQVRVWNRRWKSNLTPLQATKDNLTFVAMPMTSRHHWGTDIDFWNISNNLTVGKRQYEWLKKNANKYGFFQVYTAKSEEPNRTGYKEEKWHWSYVPLSCGYLKAYNEKVKIEEIKGFYGDNFAQKLDVIKVYVNGVTEKAKNC